MRVVPDIQQQLHRLALPAQQATVEAASDARIQQRLANLPGVPWQAHQQVGLQGQRGVFHGQVEQRQVMQLYLRTIGRSTPPAPVAIGTGQSKSRPRRNSGAASSAALSSSG